MENIKTYEVTESCLQKQLSIQIRGVMELELYPDEALSGAKFRSFVKNWLL